MWEQLIGARHGHQCLGGDGAGSDFESIDKRMQCTNGTGVGSAKQDDPAHSLGTIKVDVKVVIIECV